MTPAQLTAILNAIQAGISIMQIGSAVTNGIANRILFVGTGAVLAQSADFTWTDSTQTLALGATNSHAINIVGPGGGFALNITASTASTLIIGNSAGNGRIVVGDPGIVVGYTSSDFVGFWGAAPVVQQQLSTGAAHTVDDVITFLQLIGLCHQ